MNANGAVRGSRVGADPLTAGNWQVDKGRETSVVAGTVMTYVCRDGHSTTVRFAPLEIEEVPVIWDCASCHQLAGRGGAMTDTRLEEPYKTPLAYAKERRNDQDAEKILTDALSRLRQRT